MTERITIKDPSVYIESFRNKLAPALLLMGDKYLKKPYRHLWSPENPTFGYCYVVSELLSHYLSLKGVKHKPKTFPTEAGNHWFLELEDGAPVDLAQDDVYDYSKGKAKAFLTPNLSKRATILGKLMGII